MTDAECTFPEHAAAAEEYAKGAMRAASGLLLAVIDDRALNELLREKGREQRNLFAFNALPVLAPEGMCDTCQQLLLWSVAVTAANAAAAVSADDLVEFRKATWLHAAR